jgi:hypothetical protein
LRQGSYYFSFAQQKLQAQARAQAKNQEKKGSQLDAQKAGAKCVCPNCKVMSFVSEQYYCH